MIIFLRSIYQLTSASTNSLHSLQSFCSQLSLSRISSGTLNSLTPLLEQSHVAPLPPTTDRVRALGLCENISLSWRTSQTSLAFSQDLLLSSHSALVNREEDATQKGISITDTLQRSHETWGPSASGQIGNLNDDDDYDILGYQRARTHSKMSSSPGERLLLPKTPSL